MKMKVFDFALTEGDVSGLMESLGIKVETVKQQDVGGKNLDLCLTPTHRLHSMW